MNGRNRQDERLERLLEMPRAMADPEVLARARTRIAARGAQIEAPRALGWLARPAALAGAAAAFALSIALVVLVPANGRQSQQTLPGYEIASLSDVLLAEQAGDLQVDLAPGDTGAIQ